MEGSKLWLIMCYVNCYIVLVLSLINRYAKKTYLTICINLIIEIGFLMNMIYLYHFQSIYNGILTILLSVWITTHKLSEN